MRRGTFALDAEPASHLGTPAESAGSDSVSTGLPRSVLVHLGDVRGVGRHPDRSRLSGCCDLDGLNGQNLVCAGCGLEVATQRSDCWVSSTFVRLSPDGVEPQGASEGAGPEDR